MSAPKFTPGPWALGKGYGLHGVEVVGDEGNRAVCGVIGVDRDSRDPDGRVTGSVPTTDGWSNAHLIAAAPELYGSLEELANAADESLSCEHNELCPFAQRLRDAVIKARAELAAAVQP